MKNKRRLVFVFFLLTIFSQFAIGQTKIFMKKEGGVFTIPCTVNGLRLKFIFDTGASTVTISLTEALFMLKNGYLKESDIKGSSLSELANGQITENTKIVLHDIEFSGLILYNVEASVIHELGAPLLLGQTAMKKIGTFQFDPTNGVLTILNGKKTSINTSNEQQNLYPSNWTVQANLNKFNTGVKSTAPEEFQNIVFKKKGLNKLALKEISETGEITEIIPIEKGQIYVIERNVISVYNPEDFGNYYFYYVYYNGYLGFVENKFLDEY